MYVGIYNVVVYRIMVNVEIILGFDKFNKNKYFGVKI
jgi:hypothetical protein